MKYSAGMLDLLEALTLPEQPVLFLGTVGDVIVGIILVEIRILTFH